MDKIVHIRSIAESRKLFGMSPPKHPLVSVMWAREFPNFDRYKGMKFNTDLFMVSLKDGISGSMGYGRNSYDFSEGTMVFSKPGQVLYSEEKKIAEDAKGWMLVFHPDLIRRSELGSSIGNYSFFDYEVHEALHLSEEEQAILTDLILKIEIEFNQNIDKHSQKLIITNIQLILDYCLRYYDRQFYVRANLHQDHVTEFEQLLKQYYGSEQPLVNGLPTVKYCGEMLHMSPNYLSDMLKKETGKSAKDHIYAFVVNRAKNKLLGTTESISEIAYELGFEYPQHFSKLFKRRTGLSPNKYRMQN